MREMRCILFEDAELVKALMSYRRRSGKPLPSGQISGLEIEKKPDVIVRMTIASDGGESVVVPASGPELAAALIAYCIETHVPVPASSSKAVTTIDGHLALKITLS